MGVLAADGTTVRFHGDGREAAAAVDVLVSLDHLFVADIEGILVDVHAVEVLHVELPDAHETGAGSGLVTQLGLDLVGHLGHVFVAVDVLDGHLGDDFLVGGGQAEGAVSAVLELE